MVKVINYNTFEDLARFIYGMHIRELGSGSEGVVYLGKDKYAYKLNYEEPWASDTRQLSPNEIISKEDADLPSFAFPLEIYTVEGIIMGCKMERVKNNLLSTEHTISYMDFFDIDIYEFYEAYKVLLEDVKKLSDLKIKLFDVANNVMYDGNKLTVVDTFYYTREDYDTYEINLHIVEKAIELIFNFWLENNDLEQFSVENHDMLGYLEKVSDTMSSSFGDEKFFFEQILGKKI